MKETLSALMERDGISARQLAKETGTNRSTLSSLLSGTNESPRDSTIQPYAEFFGVTKGQIRGYEPIDGLDETLGANTFPLLSESQIGAWLSGSLSFDEVSEFVKSTTEKGARTFVFEASDDAVSPAIPKGCRVFVDPDYVHSDSHMGLKPALIRVNDRYSIRFESEDLGHKMYVPTESGYRKVDDPETVYYVVGMPERSWSDRESMDRAMKILTGDI